MYVVRGAQFRRVALERDHALAQHDELRLIGFRRVGALDADS